VSEGLRTREAVRYDYRILRPDGEERVLHQLARVVSDRSGKPVAVVGTVQDITDRKRAEEELRALTRRLVEIQEEERHNVALELHDQVGST